MAFTAGEIANIANAALDFYFNKGEAFKQSIQNRPFWDMLERKAKTFPGGKGNISIAVEGDFGSNPMVPTGGSDTVKGYTHDDKVSFFTPYNIKRAEYPWREHHIGLTMTHTELKIDGISVVDTNGERTSNHSQREMTVLVNLLEDKLFALGEQYARGMNTLAFGDGTGDAKALAGIQALVKESPVAGTVGGLSNATNKWWRNRARTAAYAAAVTATPALAGHGGGAVTSNVADGGALLQVLQYEYRQLIRYGGKPDFFVCGSDFLDAMEKELRANGIYSQQGFDASQELSIGQLMFMGNKIQYDPTLDDMGKSKRAYWIDSRAVFLEKMDSEWRKDHTPSRPADQFLLYRSITSTGAMVAKQLNSSLVIDIA
jgi:hypothetical protein